MQAKPNREKYENLTNAEKAGEIGVFSRPKGET